MEATTRVISGVNGEMIHVDVFGDPTGKPVLVHSGSPGSRQLFRPDAELAAGTYGLRLLSYDRPGYAGRPRRADRQIADAISDIQSIASALGITRMGVWGFSGGGSYAVASAAMLPELVAGAAVFASFAPYGSPGLDFSAGMSPAAAAEVELFFTDRAAARENWRQDAERLYANLSTPEGWMSRWGDTAGKDDATSWDVACYLAASVRDSMADGDDGWWDDWTAILTPWGCDPTTTRVPVHLWHGAQDRAVPIVHGRWLASHVPGIVAHISDSEDHTNVEHNNRDAAYRWLSELI